MDISNVSLDDIFEMVKDPSHSKLTWGEMMEICNGLQKIKSLADGYKKLTFWGKVKSIFSKKPVYIKED